MLTCSCTCCQVIGPTQQQKDALLAKQSKAMMEQLLPDLLEELKKEMA